MTQEEKPTEAHRKELLSKLESIIKILSDKIEDNNTVPTLRETVEPSTLNAPLETESNGDQVQNSGTLDPTLTGQQLLFEGVKGQKEDQKKGPAKIDKAMLTKMENPFLPQHVRSRLYSEDQSLQSLKNPTGEDIGSVDSLKGLHDSIIDNLIALYLPKIEADLRRRLKALVAKEIHKKTQ